MFVSGVLGGGLLASERRGPSEWTRGRSSEGVPAAFAAASVPDPVRIDRGDALTQRECEGCDRPLHYRTESHDDGCASDAYRRRRPSPRASARRRVSMLSRPVEPRRGTGFPTSGICRGRTGRGGFGSGKPGWTVAPESNSGRVERPFPRLIKWRPSLCTAVGREGKDWMVPPTGIRWCSRTRAAGILGWAPPPKSESHETKASFKQGGFRALRSHPTARRPIEDADIRDRRGALCPTRRDSDEDAGSGYFSTLFA